MRLPIYFVGWNYHESLSVPLKRLLMSPSSPFEVKAIVHQVVLAPEVDGIEIIQQDEFLSLAKTKKLYAVLMVKDELSRSLWLRRARDAGVEWLDEGELLLRGERAASAQGSEVDLGVLKLPQAFDHDLVHQLKAYADSWPDARSNGVFRAYLQFLETGILSALRSTSIYRVEHPMRQTGARSVAACVDQLGAGIAWEIASRRSSFLEQVMLVAGRHSWQYAYSGDSQMHSTNDAKTFRALFTPLGIEPTASWFELDESRTYSDRAISGFDAPRWKDTPCFFNIDVEWPSAIVDRFFEKSVPVLAWIRVGRTPRQLLELLQRYPINCMALDCDRPGPLGLQVSITNDVQKPL